MKKYNYRFFSDIVKVKLGLARLPLFVSWSISNKCPYRCMYCMSWKEETQELELEKVCNIIDDLWESGTKWISFTGGEPFLRNDLETIIDRANARNILVSVNSSGFGVKEKKNILKKIISLRLSLDGPTHIHNLIRGKPYAYDKVMEAVHSAKEAGLKIKFLAVISRLNIDSIDFLLQKAEEFGCSVIFQLTTPFMLRIHTPNPVALSRDEHIKVIEYLIKKKNKGFKIENSFSGLKCLQQRRLQDRIECWGGRVFFRIEPDGTFGICPRIKTDKQVNIAFGDIGSCINELPQENNCQGWCSSARIEFNCIFSQKIDSLLNLLKNH